MIDSIGWFRPRGDKKKHLETFFNDLYIECTWNTGSEEVIIRVLKAYIVPLVF